MQFDRLNLHGNIIEELVIEGEAEAKMIERACDYTAGNIDKLPEFIDRFPVTKSLIEVIRNIIVDPRKKQANKFRRVGSIVRTAVMDSDHDQAYETRLRLWRDDDANIAADALGQYANDEHHIQKAKRNKYYAKDFNLVKAMSEQIQTARLET